MPPRPLPLVPALGLAVTLALATPARAQAPSDTTTNLKVFPVGTPRQDVIRAMREFDRALGVRCTYCHVGDERRPPKPADFALDDKPEKGRAREMMRMVADLNGTYLKRLDRRADPPVAVQCATCHNVHDNTNVPFLRVNNAASGLCLTCHIK